VEEAAHFVLQGVEKLTRVGVDDVLKSELVIADAFCDEPALL
jgi:hypothetical protein